MRDVESMPDKAVLEDVLRDGEILLLADGRRLAVSRAATELTSGWFQEADLTLRKRKSGPEMDVTNEDTGETVQARPTTRKR
jgi:hypothetical protein